MIFSVLFVIFRINLGRKINSKQTMRIFKNNNEFKMKADNSSRKQNFQKIQE